MSSIPNLSYQPPSAAEIKASQNSQANLRLLLAQRRLYSKAKRWFSLRAVGIGVVAVGAPIAAVIWPESTVWVGAIAAGWFALNRLLLKNLERKCATRGAVVQEQFDLAVFGMPQIAVHDVRVAPEEISRLTGSTRERKGSYSDEQLLNWYPIQEGVSGAVAIAISQRANAFYSQSLLSTTATLWLSLLISWGVIAIGISIINEFTIATILLTLALPILPPLLDASDEWKRVRAAGKERRALALEIEDAIAASNQTPILGERLLAWQSQLFALRRDAPQVPNWLYRKLRPRNEREMEEAAAVLAAKLDALSGEEN